MTGVETVAREIAGLPPRLRLAFQPLVKRAMGAAVGAAAGGLVLLVTLATLAIGRDDCSATLGVLSNYFHGYDIGFLGALVGLFWGFWSGFVMGWFFAFCRNFVVATWILMIKTRAQLQANRDFLDHI